MTTIDIKDINEQESELFIEDLGKVHGGSPGNEITTLALGEEDPYPNFPDPLTSQVSGEGELISDLLSNLPEYPGRPGEVTSYALGEE